MRNHALRIAAITGITGAATLAATLAHTLAAHAAVLSMFVHG